MIPTLTATKIVRALMRASGKQLIWTNTYKNCRTVKCYAYWDEMSVDDDMAKTIHETLTKLKVNHDVHYTDGSRGSPYRGGPAVIVRIANQ